MTIQKVSVIVAVKNEEKSILKLLESLEAQSFKSFEVVIVDGGSNDQTIKIVNNFIKFRPNYNLIIANGANRAKSRNIGIASTSSDIIACTDAGVMLDKHWLENLMNCFHAEKANFVSGVYVGSGESFLQKAIIELQYPTIDKLDKRTFLPSSRSVAFKKKIWKAVKGYPVNLEKAEDTLFDLKVLKLGCNIVLAKDAKVYWPPRGSLKSLFWQYLSYMEWDIKAGLLFELKIYRQLFFSYFIIFASLLLFSMFGYIWLLIPFCLMCTYLVASGIALYLKTRASISFLIGPAIKITIYLAETAGLLKGLMGRLKEAFRAPKPTRSNLKQVELNEVSMR